MSVDLASRHALAIDAARQAGRFLKELHANRSDLVVEEKGRNDFVSRADRDAEALIKAMVTARFPEDGFVGEESGRSGPSGAPLVWAVDPLDGTTNFLKGTHNWCVSIGLLHDGRPVGGVIFDPSRDEMFDGLVGRGTRVNGAAVAVSAVADPGSAIVGLGFVPRVGAERFAADTRALLATGLNFRQFGAGALMLANVAAGRIDAYFERHMWLWDAAAGLALVTAAGGVTSSYPDGEDLLAGGGVLAANPALYAGLRTLLGTVPDPWRGASSAVPARPQRPHGSA